MPCVQEKKRREREAYVRTHRRDVDPYAGIEDPVEVIRVFHQSLPQDPLIRYLPYRDPIEVVYGRLDPDAADRLMSMILSHFRNKETDLAQELLLELAAFSSADITPALRWQALEDDPYYAMPFRGADAEVRDLLLKRIDDDAIVGDLVLRDHLLRALAWVGDSVVVERFAGWRASPPSWKAELHVRPEAYAHEAGWEVSGEGGRRNLFHSPCFALIPAAGSAAEPGLRMGRLTESACAWCGKPLTILFEFDRTDSRLRLIPWPAPRLKIATCPGCSCYGTVFAELGAGENPVWSPKNARPEYLPDDPSAWVPLPENRLILARTSRPAHHAADWFLPTSFSQVGGLPTWIQDTSYPSCPGCHRTMLFVAQLANDEVADLMEGTYYAFICPDCRMTATNYQQT